MSKNSIKRSVYIDGRKTSVSLENEFWNALREISRHRSLTTSALIATIASGGYGHNLSSAIRVFVLDYFRTSNGLRAFSHAFRPESRPPKQDTRKAGPRYRQRQV
ncbi:MAG: ribbon-helix-helix domain-containing protein [Pseudolabrys sp.]